MLEPTVKSRIGERARVWGFLKMLMAGSGQQNVGNHLPRFKNHRPNPAQHDLIVTITSITRISLKAKQNRDPQITQTLCYVLSYINNIRDPEAVQASLQFLFAFLNKKAIQSSLAFSPAPCRLRHNEPTSNGASN